MCSFYKPEGKKRGGTSSYYCAPCSEGKKGLVTLCNRERGHPQNEDLTCTQIWQLVCRTERVHSQNKPHPRSWSSERVAFMQ
ncbi:hypothetical protein GQ600_8741 [Phytophthora cactorum]|nr:hypothetical protein GQ600_8741 [Phytophthora cactorum]